MRPTVLRVLLALSLLSAPAAAGAVTLTFTNAGHESWVDSRVVAELNGFICDQEHIELPEVIATPSNDAAEAGSGLCAGSYGQYVAHSWLRFTTIGPYGMGGEGSADAAYLGGGTGAAADGRSVLGIGFALDQAATLRIHLVWHKAGAGGPTVGPTPFSVRLCVGGCAGNILTGLVDTSPADGDVTVDVPLSAAPDYHFSADLDPNIATNPFDANQPTLSRSGTYSVTLALASGTGVDPGPPPGGDPRLGFAAPNPSHGDVELVLSLPAAADVRFEVIDLAGRRVARVSDTRMEAGRGTLRWRGLDDAGHAAPAGMYFARVAIDGRTLPVRSMLLVR
jgi:hypothetical protein